MLKKRGVTRALFANPRSITWLTGFTPPIPLAPHLFAGGPPFLWYKAGHFTLVVVDAYPDITDEINKELDCTVVSYQGYTYKEALGGADHLKAGLRKVVGSGRNGAKLREAVGLEERHVPVHFSDLLLEAIGDKGIKVAIDGWLQPLRIVKTAEEMEKLRENFALADIGQAAVRREVQAGKREIDIWTAAHSAIQRAAG